MSSARDLAQRPRVPPFNGGPHFVIIVVLVVGDVRVCYVRRSLYSRSLKGFHRNHTIRWRFAIT